MHTDIHQSFSDCRHVFRRITCMRCVHIPPCVCEYMYRSISPKSYGIVGIICVDGVHAEWKQQKPETIDCTQTHRLVFGWIYFFFASLATQSKIENAIIFDGVSLVFITFI